MKNQRNLIIALVIILLISIFAILNVESVPVNFGFVTASWPLILIILGSLLAGALISILISTSSTHKMKKDLKETREKAERLEKNAKSYNKEMQQKLEAEIEALKAENASLKAEKVQPETPPVH